jgi:hypothetical protein
MLTKDDVLWAYRFYLGREPEKQSTIEFWINSQPNRSMLIKQIENSDEYKNKHSTANALIRSPFWHYASTFNAIEIINKYAISNITPSPDHVTNFLGVKVRPEFFPSILSSSFGVVEPVPIPANWHADIAEWASCLRSIDLSADRFVMLELGCGWGCWMNNCGVTAKHAGKQIKLYGVEADTGHIIYAKNAFNDNGITEQEFVLSQGIAGKSASIVLFPSIESGIDWSGTAIFNPSQQQQEAADSGKYARLPVINIGDLIKKECRLDFMHVDIQGAELDLLSEIFDLLCIKVRYIFIGTHSKQIEGGLIDLFTSNGIWKLEVERPAIFQIIDGSPKVTVDGVQAWRNSTFD